MPTTSPVWPMWATESGTLVFSVSHVRKPGPYNGFLDAAASVVTFPVAIFCYCLCPLPYPPWPPGCALVVGRLGRRGLTLLPRPGAPFSCHLVPSPLLQVSVQRSHSHSFKIATIFPILNFLTFTTC